MFIAHNKVRMHDTDMAGILYFANQFRYVHDAFEDFMESEGLPFDYVFYENEYVFVIVHAESSYKKPLKVGEILKVHVAVETIGNSSFTMNYHIYKPGDILAGTAKTVHVTLDATARTKVHVPEFLRRKLEKHKRTEDQKDEDPKYL